jgi:hypothetical protein
VKYGRALKTAGFLMSDLKSLIIYYAKKQPPKRKGRAEEGKE